MRKWISSLVLIIAAALAGCSTVQVGRDFDLQTFSSRVERGVTTESQVRGWLGAPTGTGVVVDTTGERYDEWTYYYGGGRLPNMADAHLKMLQVRFDGRGIVRGFNWSGETPKK